ncbi:hypothetical protein RJ55_05949 [Drechmeria coniospora]|nr:hypothetical protein RJ55_05949 [Drechmeria coniospora]
MPRVLYSTSASAMEEEVTSPPSNEAGLATSTAVEAVVTSPTVLDAHMATPVTVDEQGHSQMPWHFEVTATTPWPIEPDDAWSWSVDRAASTPWSAESDSSTPWSAETGVATPATTLAASETATSSPMALERPIDCTCVMTWRTPGDLEGFEWLYDSHCPIPPEMHDEYIPLFTSTLEPGRRVERDPRGGLLVVDVRVIEVY